MIIYSVVINDTHSDVDVRPFLSKKKAFKYARTLANELAYSKDNIKEIVNYDDWLLFIEYSTESYLFITEHEIKNRK